MVIVVGLDFSDHSLLALQKAIELAERMDGSVVLVHAIVPSVLAGEGGPVGEALLENDVHEWRTMEQELLKLARKRVKADAVARKGPAHEVLLQEAESRHASLIVVGSHGRSGLKRMVLGSVSEAIIRQSKIPVVVVPA